MRIETKWSDAPVDLGAIGRTGENAARVIEFDCTDALADYPDASIICAVRRPCDSAAYLCSLTADGKKRMLTLTKAECAVKGRLHMELRVVDGDTVLKTATYTGWVEEALTGSADKPGNPAADLLNRIDSTLQSATETQKKLLIALDGVDTAVNGANTAAENAQTIADTVQAKLDNGDFVGPAGKPGSDASVTADNIQAALGYAPVKDVQVAGSSVLDGGVAKVPIAQADAPGVVSVLTPQDSGIWNDNGSLKVSYATDAEISGRTGTRKAIVCANMDYAVKAAMCDGKGAAWTAAEQKAARERMGADGNYVLIEETVLTEDASQFERAQEPDGTPYNFTAIRAIVKFIPGQMNGSFFCFCENNGIRIVGGASQALEMPSSSSPESWRSVVIFNARPGYGGYYDCDVSAGSQGSAMMVTRYPNGQYTNEETEKKIQSISFYLYGYPSVQFIAGTEISIYGVRA